MRVRVRSLKRFLIVSLLTVGALSLAGAALADYTGPDRDISTFSWERLVCDYQAVYDPPGPGYYGCGLTLYEPPDGNCETNVDDYFTSSACGWPAGTNCNTVNCDVSRSSSVDGCNQGQPGCRSVERIVSQPPATISGSVTCGVPGSGGWCRGDADLSLSGSEPLSGYSVLALEGTQNGAPFACAGAACDVGLFEGGNNFSFWAVSSYGDTSNMGSASGSLDSEDPSLSGSASGTPGDNGWYVSSVTVEASASDGVSGLASLDVRIDGGGWSGYGGPVTIGDGSHEVELRAVDVAGNSTSESFSLDIDTQSPIVDLFAAPSFCPGCGEALDITIVAQDGGSGIAAWTLEASGVSVASGTGQIGQTLSWDGGGLGGGVHTLELEGRDAAGNSAAATFDFSVILPTPAPNDDDDEGEGPAPFSLPSPTPSTTGTTVGGLAATRTPLPTRTPVTVNFGGPPAAPQGPAPGESISSLQSPPTSSPAATSSVSAVLYGAAAAALIATAMAIGLDQKRKREAEEARQRAEMEAANRRAEAEEAEWRATMGQIVSRATGGISPSPGWQAAAAAAATEAASREKKAVQDARLTRKEAMLEPKIPLQAKAKTSKPTTKLTKAPPQPRPDIETIRAQNYAGYAPLPAQPVTVPWWRQLLDNANEFGEKAIKAARDFGSQVVRYGVPIVATTLVGATTYQWAKNLSSPNAFTEAREDSRAQVAQLLETYPDFLEPRDVRQQSVEGHPYLQMSRAMDGLDTLTEVAANYIDAAWQQNPVVQQGVPLLRQTAEQSCPRWNETVWRICGSGLHLAAGIVEQPADTGLGVLNGFVIQPTEGIAKILAFGVENNAIALGGDIIEAGRQSGVNGVIDTVGDFFHRVSAMTTDGDVEGGLMAAALLGLAFAAPAAAFVLVAGSTLDSLSAMGKQILGAPTWEKAMQIAGSRETRTLVVTVAILLALGTAKGVKDWVQWERARPSLTPNVVAAFERLPIAERSPVLEAAVRLGLNDAQVMGYIESMRGLPPQVAEILQRLPVEERVGVFTSTAKFLSSAQGTPYEYNMFELGPLGGELEGIAPNFRGGQYTEFVAPSNLLAFRGQAGTRFANWMAFDPPTGLGSQLRYGVRPLWYDPATGRIAGISLHDAGVVVLIREGTTLYVGPVSYQGGAFGFVDALQIYIRDAATNPGVVRLGPWELGQ